MIWRKKVFLLVSVLWLCLAVDISANDLGQAEKKPEKDIFAPIIEHKGQPDEILTYERRNDDTVLQLRATGKNHREGGSNKGLFGLEANFGQLFQKIGDQYAGYYYLSGRLENYDRQRFNATIGYFLPVFGGESVMTYRALNSEVRDMVRTEKGMELLFDDEIEENALEQGFGILYRKRIDSFIREYAFRYIYTHLGGESVDGAIHSYDSEIQSIIAQADIGFGDVDTHEGLVEFAAGVDGIDSDFIQGIRFDLAAGFQGANYEGYRNTEDINDSGFSFYTKLQACTPYGSVKVGYQDSQASRAVSAGHNIGGFEIYYKGIDYEYGRDENIVGIGLTFDLFNPGAVLDRSCKPLFHPSDNGYRNVSQMRHVGYLASDEYTAKPIVQAVFGEVYRLDKTRIPANVQIDTTTDPNSVKLLVPTGCRQLNTISVNPPAAAPAFGTNGNNVSITMSSLPNANQTISVIMNDDCCGNTQILVGTRSTPNLTVNSINVTTGVGCQPTTATTVTTTALTTETTSSTVGTSQPQNPTPSTPPQCLAAGENCLNANLPCCSGNCVNVGAIAPVWRCQ